MHTESWQSVGPTLDECIKCNICASYCPVAAVTDLFPGPKYVGPQAQRFRENGQPHSPDHSVDYCSGCRVCNEVCPTGVRITEINTRARAQIAADHGIPLRNRMLGRSDVLGKLGSIAPGLANFGLHNPLSRSLADSVMKISKGAQLPRWSSDGTFAKWMKKTADQRLKSDKKVVYYHGCSTMYYEPFIGKATVAVFEHHGYEVIVPEQGCCGLPLLNNAEFPEAKKYHQRNLDWLVPYARQGYPIVGTSSSCTLTLKEEAPEMLDMHGPEAHDLKMAVWDIFEWLRELQDRGSVADRLQAAADGSALPLTLPVPRPPHRFAFAGDHEPDPGAGHPREPRPLLRRRGHLRLQEGEVPDRDGCRRGTVQLRQGAGRGRDDDIVQFGDLPLAHRDRHRPALPPSD